MKNKVINILAVILVLLAIYLIGSFIAWDFQWFIRGLFGRVMAVALSLMIIVSAIKHLD